MAPQTLKEPYHTLEAQIIETMLAGSSGYDYPKSVSDMRYCVRNLLKMFDVRRRPLSISLPYAYEDAVEQAVPADPLPGADNDQNSGSAGG